MSYIYTANGYLKKIDLYEHFPVCFGSLCVDKKSNIQKDNPEDEVECEECEECEICTQCSTSQCPIQPNCPTCDDINDISEYSNIEEPYVIKEQMNENNIASIFFEYINKLEQYDVNKIDKYLLNGDIQDMKLFFELYNKIELNYEFINFTLVLQDEYEKDRIELIDYILENNNIINKQNIYALYLIEISFNQHSVNINEQFSNFNYNNIINFNNFNLNGMIKLYLIDYKVDENIFRRYLYLDFNNSDRLKLYNIFNLNETFYIKKNNIKISDYENENTILTLGKKFLQKMFLKSDFKKHLYLSNEIYDNNFFDSLKKNIDNLTYKKEGTLELLNSINDLKINNKNIDDYYYYHEYGNASKIINIFLFNFNLDFYIVDLSFENNNIYRFLIY